MIRGDASLCEDFFSYRTLEVVQDYYPARIAQTTQNIRSPWRTPDSSSKNMTRPKEERVRGLKGTVILSCRSQLHLAPSFQPSIRSRLGDCIIFSLPPCPLAGAGRASHALWDFSTLRRTSQSVPCMLAPRSAQGAQSGDCLPAPQSPLPSRSTRCDRCGSCR